MKPDDLFIIFVGNPERGKRLQEEAAASDSGWTVSIVTELTTALAEYVFFKPDLVILDDFPESNLAMSVYFHLRTIDAGPFLALNKKPNALKFLHVNSLSFMRMINRNSEQKDLIREISAWVRAYRKRRFRQYVRRGREEKRSSFEFPKRRLSGLIPAPAE